MAEIKTEGNNENASQQWESVCYTSSVGNEQKSYSKLIETHFRTMKKCQEDIFLFLYSSKLSDIFFFPGATFFFSSLHKLFSGIFLHFIWTLSVKRGCSCFKTVKTFFLYLYFFLLHVKLSENKFQKENYIFILCYIWNRNIFSLTMTFSSRRIFSSEIKIKWIFIYPCETESKQRDKRQTFLKNIFSLHLTQKMSHNKNNLSVKTIEKKLLFFIFPGQFFLSCLTPQSITPLFL